MIRYFLINVLVIIFSVGLIAADPISIDKLNRKISVKEMDHYIDSTAKLDYAQFKENKNLFYHSPEPIYGSRNRQWMYWMTFELEGEILENEDLLLVCRDNRISHLEIWVNGEAQTQKPVGTNHLFNNRKVNHRLPAYPLPKKKHLTIDICIKSEQTSFFSFQIVSKNIFLKHSIFEERLIGSYYGIIILAILFSLFMLIKFRSSIYITYPIFASVTLLIFAYLDGGGFQFVWGEYPKVNLYLLLLIPFILLISLGGMVLSVLDAWNWNSRYFKLICGSIFLSLLGYIFAFTVPHYYIHNLFYMVPFLVMIYACILKYKSGNKSMLVFIVGFVFVVLTNTLYTLQPFFSSRYSNFIIQFSPHFGVLALTMSMMYTQFRKFYNISEGRKLERKRSIRQLKQLNQIKDRINEEIAEKVAVQTKELERKNAVIHMQNAELQEANDKLKEQTDEIVNLNLKLNQENQDLKIDVQKITESRILQNTIPFDDFKRFFDTDESCYALLESLKWQNGFNCLKCGNTKYGKGKGVRARRCTKCGTNESATSNTIFHRIHFPILKGFYILFLVNKHGDQLVSKDLSEIVDLRLATCWKFSKKIKEKKTEIEKSGKLIESWIDLI